MKTQDLKCVRQGRCTVYYWQQGLALLMYLAQQSKRKGVQMPPVLLGGLLCGRAPHAQRAQMLLEAFTFGASITGRVMTT